MKQQFVAVATVKGGVFVKGAPPASGRPAALVAVADPAVRPLQPARPAAAALALLADLAVRDPGRGPSPSTCLRVEHSYCVFRFRVPEMSGHENTKTRKCRFSSISVVIRHEGRCGRSPGGSAATRRVRLLSFVVSSFRGRPISEPLHRNETGSVFMMRIRRGVVAAAWLVFVASGVEAQPVGAGAAPDSGTASSTPAWSLRASRHCLYAAGRGELCPADSGRRPRGAAPRRALQLRGPYPALGFPRLEHRVRNVGRHASVDADVRHPFRRHRRGRPRTGTRSCLEAASSSNRRSNTSSTRRTAVREKLRLQLVRSQFLGGRMAQGRRR